MRPLLPPKITELTVSFGQRSFSHRGHVRWHTSKSPPRCSQNASSDTFSYVFRCFDLRIPTKRMQLFIRLRSYCRQELLEKLNATRLAKVNLFENLTDSSFIGWRCRKIIPTRRFMEGAQINQNDKTQNCCTRQTHNLN